MRQSIPVTARNDRNGEGFRRVGSLLITVITLVGATPTPAANQPPTGESPFSMQRDQFGKEPTYIRSDTLTLNTNDRKFLYSGNVEVHQGDLTLTASELEGSYNDQNKIQTMVARSDVFIEKADLKARSQRATYEQSSDTLVLTENPEVDQNGSVLTADTIRILLREDRSIAEGSVRVKLVQPTPTAGSKEPAKITAPAAPPKK